MFPFSKHSLYLPDEKEIRLSRAEKPAGVKLIGNSKLPRKTDTAARVKTSLHLSLLPSRIRCKTSPRTENSNYYFEGCFGKSSCRFIFGEYFSDEGFSPSSNDPLAPREKKRRLIVKRGRGRWPMASVGWVGQMPNSDRGREE